MATVTKFGTTDVEVCSRALVLLGESSIDSLDGDDDITTICNQVYPLVRAEVMTIHKWRFTIEKHQLARKTATPTNQYQYAFAQPSNRLDDPFAIYSDGSVGAHPMIGGWDIFGGDVYSDEPDLYGDYQVNIPESLWPPYMQVLMSLVLAGRLAEPVTDDTSKKREYLIDAYGTPGTGDEGGYLAKARILDSQSRPSDGFKDFSLVDARFS